MRTINRASGLALLCLLTLSFVGTGCRSHAGFRKQYQQLRPAMLKGNWAQAATTVKSTKDKVFRKEDRVMYWLNLGTLEHYAGQYEASMANFVKAEKAIQDLWTTSISSEASKYLTNESTQDYPGEDFEKTLVYFYTALNRVKQGKMGDALVEARRADEFLKKIQIQYEKEKGQVGSLYKQDAFMLWIVGLFYEIEGSWSDAFLAYQTAYKAYGKEYGKFGASSPKFLQEDLLRTAQLAGRMDAVAGYSKKFGGASKTLQSASKGMAEIIVIHANGEAPYKKQHFIHGKMPDGYMMRIAIPKFVPNPHRIQGARVTVGSKTSNTELVEPVTRIALDNYKHRLGAITARAIARAVIKYVASQAAKKVATKVSGNALVGALIGVAGNVASVASENADLRAWTMLPSDIGVTRMWVPAGAHTVTVAYTGSNGQIGRSDKVSVTVKAGERRVVSVRTLR